MRLGKITRRWILNTMLLVVVFVAILSIIAMYAVQNVYYSSVRNTLGLKDVGTYFNVSTVTKSSFNEVARDFIESFNDKNRMAVWIIDSDGKVILSSNGFFEKDSSKFKDYQDALATHEDGYWSGRLESGENVYARTSLVNISGESVAVRLIISLKDIDIMLRKIDTLIILAAFIIIMAIVLPGTFFIQSIARSIKEISDAAGQIAKGKLDTRVEGNKSNDEIGELCDSINNMAVEISNADKVKNDFLSTISHELRTPLTAIRGWGETLVQIGQGDPELTKRGMNVIISESGRLAGMVEELLDFSRMQSGRLSLRIEKIDVLAELDETVFSLKERALREGKELIYNAVNLPAPMEADPNRIKQVFVNILDNALKYTQQGGKILVEAKLSKPTVLEITVSDNGNGISKDDLPHVKERFYKADMSARGSGIGLAVVDEIIRLHKGEWMINSILGKGTTVTILLPVEETELPEERGTYEKESMQQ